MKSKTARILIYTLLGIILSGLILLISAAIFLQTKSGQKKVSEVVTQYLTKKIDSPFKASISYKFPDWINLKSLLIIDQKADTLIYSENTQVDLDLLALVNNEVKINKVKLQNSYINIYENNGTANYQYILDAFASKTNDSTSKPFLFQLSDIDISNLRLKYNTSEIKSHLLVSQLITGFNQLKPESNQYYFNPVKVQGLKLDIAILESNKASKTDTKTTLPDIKMSTFSGNNIHISIKNGQNTYKINNLELAFLAPNLDLPQEKFSFDYFNAKANQVNSNSGKIQKSISNNEIDFSDLQLNQFVLKANNLSAQSFSDIKGKISELRFFEKSGFKLENLTTDFQFKDNKIALSKLDSKTQYSSINADLSAQLDSINVNNSIWSANVNKASISPTDVLFFARSLNANPYFVNIKNQKVIVNGDLNGTFNKAYINNLNASISNDTRLKIKGTIINFTSPEFDLVISELRSSKKDINDFLPKNTLPPDINLPENFSLAGTLKGNLDDLKTSLMLNTEQGTTKINANIKDLNTVPKYEGTLVFGQLKAGSLINNQDLGTVNGYLNFDGIGFTNPKLNVSGRVNDIVYQNKTYRNIEFNSSLDNQILDTKLSINDTTANMEWQGKIDFNKPIVSIQGATKINLLNLKSLGITEQNLKLKGDFAIKELIADRANPKLNLSGENVILYQDDQKYPIGDLKVFTQNSVSENQLSLITGFMDLNLKGNFQYDQLGQIVLTEINKYFKLPDFKENYSLKSYDINLKGKVDYDPVFTAFVPQLKKFDNLVINSRITSDKVIVPLSGNIVLGQIQYDSIQVSDLKFDFSGNGQELKYSAAISEIVRSSFRVRNASLEGKLEDNLADFGLSVKDSSGVVIHALHGFVNSVNNALKVSFDEEGTRLFYEPWSGNPYGFFEYSSKGIRFSDVIFTQNNKQIVRINSLTDTPNGPLSVFTKDIDLEFFSKAIFRDSTYLSGMLDLDLELVEYLDGSPSFTGDVEVKNLIYEGQKIGNLTGIAKSVSDSEIFVNALIESEDNNMEVKGSFYPKQKENLDLVANIKKLNAKTLQIFVVDVLKDMDGSVKGDFIIKGSTSKPQISGKLGFDDFGFRLVETNALFKIKDQYADFNDMKLIFSDFTLADIDKNSLQVNGNVNLNQIPDFDYSLKLKSSKFKFVDNQKGQNPLYYGEGYFGTDLTVVGKNLDFKLSGDVLVDEKSNLTLLLEEENEAASELNEIVQFVDFNQKEIKVIEKKEERSINFANSVNINVEVPKKATLNILMDPLTGDLLTVNGEGKFNLGFDNNANLFMIGKFDIKSGTYDLTYQVIKKEFSINEASRSQIVWSGDPLKGVINITASNDVQGKQPLSDMIKSDPEFGKITGPVRIDLVLTGVIENPEVNFEVVMYEKDLGGASETAKNAGYKVINDKNEKIENKESNYKKSEINNQAVFLLLTGKVSPESLIQNLESASNYEDIARRKASELISNELNKYATSLIKGLDVNLNLESGFNTGRNQRNTNLNLGVSKKLANERLILSVGKNFELENKELRSDEIFDNLQANWIISKDGRYRLNIFRKVKNDLVLEGSVIETGAGFTLAIDYDTWHELISKKNKSKN